MIRVFTTFFHFRNRTYIAVITRLECVLDIYIPDESLHEILPSGRIRHHIQDNALTNVSLPDSVGMLLSEVLQSIRNHQLFS